MKWIKLGAGHYRTEPPGYRILHRTASEGLPWILYRPDGRASDHPTFRQAKEAAKSHQRNQPQPQGNP